MITDDKEIEVLYTHRRIDLTKSEYWISEVKDEVSDRSTSCPVPGYEHLYKARAAFLKMSGTLLDSQLIDDNVHFEIYNESGERILVIKKTSVSWMKSLLKIGLVKQIRYPIYLTIYNKEGNSLGLITGKANKVMKITSGFSTWGMVKTVGPLEILVTPFRPSSSFLVMRGHPQLGNDAFLITGVSETPNFISKSCFCSKFWKWRKHIKKNAILADEVAAIYEIRTIPNFASDITVADNDGLHFSDLENNNVKGRIISSKFHEKLQEHLPAVIFPIESSCYCKIILIGATLLYV